MQFQAGDVVIKVDGKWLPNAEKYTHLLDLMQRVCGDVTWERVQIGQLQRLLDEGYIRVDAVEPFANRRHISISINGERGR